jgi:hypothetical protein
MTNTAYKHLDAKLRIAELTVGQWSGIFAGVVLALIYGYFVHPFGTMLTLVSAVYLGGIPVAASLLAGFSEFDLWLLVRSAVRWRRRDGWYLPGPGVVTDGYRLLIADADLHRAERAAGSALDPAELWEAL